MAARYLGGIRRATSADNAGAPIGYQAATYAKVMPLHVNSGKVERRRPLGLILLVLFFSFGTLVCSLIIAALLFPDGMLEPLWSLKPEAQMDFQRIGGWAIALMGVVGAACGLAAIGLARYAEWGRRIALGVLTVNLLGDVLNAALRSDAKTLIGLPIGGAMIAYLMSRRVRGSFCKRGNPLAEVVTIILIAVPLCAVRVSC